MYRLLPCLLLTTVGTVASVSAAEPAPADGGAGPEEVASASDKPQQVFTLDADSAAELARARTDRALAARAGAAATSARARERISVLYPQLSAQAQYIHRGDLPERNLGAFGTVETGRENEYTLTARGEQLLWSFGRIGAALDAREALGLLSDADLTASMLDIGHRARLAVALVQLADAEHAVAEARVAQRESELGDAQARFEAGDVAQLDVREARADLIQAQNQLRTAELARERARLELRSAVAVDSGVVEVASELARPQDLTLLIDAARNGVEHGAAVRALGAEAALRRSDRADARSRTLPEISAFGEWGLNGEDVDDLDDQWSVGLSVTWTAWDGGRDYAAMERIAQEETQVRRLQRAEVRERQRRFEGLLAQLRSLDARIAAEREAVVLAEENYADARAQYRAGVITQTRVGDANLAITLARLRLLQLIHAELVAAAELRLLAE